LFLLDAGGNLVLHQNITSGIPSDLISQVLGLLTTETKIVPSDFKIFQNYPNPFNPTTFLRFNMEREGMVSVTINDIHGRIVKTLLNGPQVPGYNTVQWNATSDNNELVSAGTYFYTVRVEGKTKSKKITLLK